VDFLGIGDSGDLKSRSADLPYRWRSHNLALSKPPCVGTEVPIQGAPRADREGGLSMCDDVLPAVGM
jgi:hypothetical protein